LVNEDFTRAADMLTVPVAVIRAVAEVESAGRGFIPDGRPAILFESHVFGRLTNHRHSNARDIRGRPLSTRSWDRTTYGPAGAWQHDGRLAPAARLDNEAAHRAASWGYFQILGTNHRTVGHPTIQGFVTAMQSGASAHIDMLVKFIRNNRLDVHLQRIPPNWEAFARAYNGPGFRQNRYDERLAAAFRRWSQQGSDTPTLQRGARGIAVERLQRMLNNQTGSALAEDGIFGSLTEVVVRQFQTARGLVVDGIVGPRTWAALNEEVA
jgi:hypothetical protein